VQIIVIAGLHRHVAFRFVTRRFGDEVDRTARRVLAEQRALRTAQDFNALEIKNLRTTEELACDVHLVIEHTSG
jgi:hypothetical protein